MHANSKNKVKEYGFRSSTSNLFYPHHQHIIRTAINRPRKKLKSKKQKVPLLIFSIFFTLRDVCVWM